MEMIEESHKSSTNPDYKKRLWPKLSGGKIKALEFKGDLDKIQKEGKGRLIEIAPGIYRIDKDFDCSEQEAQKAYGITTKMRFSEREKSNHLFNTEYSQAIGYEFRAKAYQTPVHKKKMLDCLA